MKNLLTDYQIHEQLLQKTIVAKKRDNNSLETHDPEYVLEFGSHPDLSTVVNKTTTKSLVTKYRTNVGGTEAGTTRSVKFGGVM